MFPRTIYDEINYMSPFNSWSMWREPLVVVKDSDNFASPLPKYHGKSRRWNRTTALTISKRKKQYAKMESIRKESRKRNR